jgi:ABC-type multidrug transport system fused ATPase/permease subunit
VVPAVPAAQLDWTIECKDVTFWYPSDPDEKKIFSGLNLTIPHGQTVGICGQTGCGKSTLLRLLTRLYDVQGGSIVLNGRDIRDFEPAWLREQVAFVTYGS